MRKLKRKKVIIKEIPLQNEKEKIYRKIQKKIEKKDKLKTLETKKKKNPKPPTPPPTPPSSSSEDEPSLSDSSDSSIDSQDYECPPLSDDEPTPMPESEGEPQYPPNYHTDEPEIPAPIKRKRKVYR